MIRKTTITSLAILVAAISVATTMTMVQADPTGDLIDINVPTASDGLNTAITVVAGAEYTSTMTVVDAELLFTDGFGNGDPDGTIDHIDEISINNAGSGVHSGTFTFESGAPDGTVDFADDGDNIVQLGELTVGIPGAGITDLDTATLQATAHPIMVDIDDGTVEIDLSGGSPNTGDIIVTISDIQWVGESGTLSDFTCSSSVGATSIPKFNKDTLQVNITSVTVDTIIDIDCQFEAEHGFISKTLLEPCLSDGVVVKNDTAQECTFHISYTGANATIIDTLPAEWNATTVQFGPNTGTGGGECDVDEVAGQTGKNKKGNDKSATGFTCEDIGEDAEFDVTVDLRQSPGQGHGKKGELVFKPTSCELQINSGATALLVNVTSGQLAIGTLDGLPLVLNSTDPLDVPVVSNIERGIDCP